VRVWLDHHGVAIRVAGRMVALKPPSERAYWSERERINCRVWPLPFGWRIVWRTLS
jgi:hypothetical protein